MQIAYRYQDDVPAALETWWVQRNPVTILEDIQNYLQFKTSHVSRRAIELVAPALASVRKRSRYDQAVIANLLGGRCVS